MKPVREVKDFKIRFHKKLKPPIVIDQQDHYASFGSSNKDLTQALQEVKQSEKKQPTWRQLQEEREQEKAQKQKAYDIIPTQVIQQLQKSIKRKEIEVPDGQDFYNLAETFFSKVQSKLSDLDNSELKQTSKYLSTFKKKRRIKQRNEQEITMEGLEFTDTADEFFEQSLQQIRSKSYFTMNTPRTPEQDESTLYEQSLNTSVFLQSTGRSKQTEHKNQVKTQLNLISHQLRDLQNQHLANKLTYKETASSEAVVDSQQRKMLRKMAKGREGSDEFTQEVIHSTSDIKKNVLLQIKLEKKAFEQRRTLMKFRTPKNLLQKVQKQFGDQNYFNKNYY